MTAIRPSGVITLLTDFGLTEPFVGVMKGVLLQAFAEARIVDLTHGIDQQDVAEAAFWLACSYRHFPEGTVHVAVVDPGVGTERAALAAEVDGHYFIAPDNGLLAPIFAVGKDQDVRRISLKRLDLKDVSRTFHGRDVFAPAAAELAAGRRWLTEMGPVVNGWVPSPVPPHAVVEGGVEGTVVTIDRFGNLITNIPSAAIGGWSNPEVRIDRQVMGVVGTYGEAGGAELVALINAFDHLEIACPNGSAQQRLGRGKGALVRVVAG